MTSLFQKPYNTFMGKKKIDIIVPCYNEEQNIEAFYSETQAVAARIRESGEYEHGYDFAYIFIDDGSTDGTLKQIKRVADLAAAEQTTVKYISFSRNFGKEAAMYAGLKASAEGATVGTAGSPATADTTATPPTADTPEAGGPADYAVIMDADLQHPPRLIEEMLRAVEKTGCDSAAARRVSRKGEPRIRSAFARLFYKLMNRYCEIEIVDGAVDFRLMSRRMVRAIVNMPESQRFSKGIFAWVGFDTEWIEFENTRRLSGETKWTVWKLTKYAIDGFIDFADSPLKFAGAFGGVIAAGSAVYLIVEVIKTIVMGKDTPGYASTVCLILFFGGAIIAILGLIGEYIGRMYLETKRRPIFIEKESNLSDTEEGSAAEEESSIER